MNIPELEEATRQSILNHNLEVLYYLTMQPGHIIELGLAVFIGITILTFSISKIHFLGKSGTASLLLTLFVVIVGSFLLIEVASFTEVWFAPLVGLENLAGIMVASAVGAAFLFMVVPFTRFVFKSGYFISMSSWVIGMVFALAALFLVSRTYDEPRSGTTPIDTMQSVRGEFEYPEESMTAPEYQ
ncbi:MAG: hypothetical protein AAF649_05945 [Verrucomicrobiota bacterium]